MPEDLRKITKTVAQGGYPLSGPIFELGSPEHEAGVPTTRPRHSVAVPVVRRLFFSKYHLVERYFLKSPKMHFSI